MTLPPSTIKQLLEASWAVMKQQKEQGKIVDYFYSPLGCTVVIVDYENSDEWVKDQMSIPILSYYEQDIYPLSDLGKTVEAMVDALKATGE